MTIKQKDGNVYVLQGPNKLAKNQEKWDLSKLVFHNFNWDEIKIKNKEVIRKIIKDEVKSSFEPDFDKNKITYFEEPEEENTQKEKTNNEEIDEKELNFNMPFLKNKVLMKCLPAIIESKEDPLYGDKWINIRYSSKIVFPTVIIKNQDLILEFWTSDPNQVVSEHSIVYPFQYETYNNTTQNYDRVPFDDRRWWKISQKEKKDMGWLFKATPSDTQPDFS
jgi:hypothetical protein